MTRKEELIDALQRSFDGPAWHGPSLEEALADVTAEEASYRPAADVHTIWELALHAAAWAGEVANRLDGNPPGEPAQGDWPQPFWMPQSNAGFRCRFQMPVSDAGFRCRFQMPVSDADFRCRFSRRERRHLTTASNCGI